MPPCTTSTSENESEKEDDENDHDAVCLLRREIALSSEDGGELDGDDEGTHVELVHWIPR